MFFIMSILGCLVPSGLAMILKHFIDKFLNIKNILSKKYVIIFFALLLPFAFIGGCSGFTLYYLLNQNTSVLIKTLLVSTVSWLYMFYFFDFEENQ